MTMRSNAFFMRAIVLLQNIARIRTGTANTAIEIFETQQFHCRAPQNSLLGSPLPSANSQSNSISFCKDTIPYSKCDPWPWLLAAFHFPLAGALIGDVLESTGKRMLDRRSNLDLNEDTGEHRAVQMGSWLSLLLTVLVLWVLTILAVVHQSETFNVVVEFDVELPTVTALVLDIPLAAYPACASVVSLLLLTKEFAWRNKFGSLVTNLVTLGAIIVCFLVHREILLIPVRSLIQQLS